MSRVSDRIKGNKKLEKKYKELCLKMGEEVASLCIEKLIKLEDKFGGEDNLSVIKQAYEIVKIDILEELKRDGIVNSFALKTLSIEGVKDSPIYYDDIESSRPCVGAFAIGDAKKEDLSDLLKIGCINGRVFVNGFADDFDINRNVSVFFIVLENASLTMYGISPSFINVDIELGLENGFE